MHRLASHIVAANTRPEMNNERTEALAAAKIMPKDLVKSKLNFHRMPLACGGVSEENQSALREQLTRTRENHHTSTRFSSALEFLESPRREKFSFNIQ